ncbi:hypothetical protein GOODEAATRI_020961 [Goodea atripinnis]|uniref:Uncharacterized protein n=1 Tax=Goodea atripinnis TaxID=208336 RepID=A0ABV0N6F5_9TELE
MNGSHCCMDRGADDDSDLCPTCFGRDHLMEVLSEHPYMNYSFMPQEERVARLAQLCPQDDAGLPPSVQMVHLGHSNRCGDVLSLAAPASHFRDEEEAQPSQASESGSFSFQSTVGEPGDGSMRDVRCVVLRQLQLELPLREVSASGSAFFRSRQAPIPFSVPEGVACLLAGPNGIVMSLHRQFAIWLSCTSESRQAWTICQRLKLLWLH